MSQFFTCLLLLVAFSYCNNSIEKEAPSIISASAKVRQPPFKLYSRNARKFIRKHDFNKQYCFFIDMSIESGKKRFFIYDFQKDVAIAGGLVAHGSCNTEGLTRPQFSNQQGSGCSSLGKYKIGRKYSGRFGAAYKLHGLDSSNSNAFDRAVVLHKYECVPDYELMETPICNSLGCPMVSPKFFTQLEAIIDGSKKPILLWMYE